MHASEAVDHCQGWPDEDVHFHNKHRETLRRDGILYLYSVKSSMLSSVYSSVEQSKQTINKCLANIDPGTISAVDTI